MKEMLLPVTKSVWFLCEEGSCTDFLAVHVMSCKPSMRSPSVRGIWDVSFHRSNTSGRGTKRPLVYRVGQAEVITITVDSWVRTGVLAFVG